MRVLNPTEEALEAHLRISPAPRKARLVRLDEEVAENDRVTLTYGGSIRFWVPATPCARSWSSSGVPAEILAIVVDRAVGAS